MKTRDSMDSSEVVAKIFIKNHAYPGEKLTVLKTKTQISGTIFYCSVPSLVTERPADDAWREHLEPKYQVIKDLRSA